MSGAKKIEDKAADAQAAKDAQGHEAAKPKKAPYEVAPGCAITCSRKRVIGAGEAITVADLEGDKAGFEGFVKSGLIVKNS
jgi:hypothetical protein